MKLLVKNIQYFEMEVHPDSIDELDDWQTVVDTDFDLDDESVEQISEDYYEFEQVIKE